MSIENPYASPQTAATLTFNRPRYVSDQSWSWLWFPVTAAFAVVGSCALAYLLAVLFRAGYYWIFIVPLVFTIATATLVAAAVYWGQCRNRWLGGTLGLACGLTTYLGYFYCDMVAAVGPDVQGRLDLLPAYIFHRVTTDVSTSTHNPNPQVQRPIVFLNALTFVAELGLFVCYVPLVGWHTAERAFDPQRGRWSTLKYIVLPQGTSERIKHALASGTLGPVLQTHEAIPPQVNTPHCLLTLELLRTADSPVVILSAREFRMPGQVSLINDLVAFFPRTIPKIQLEPLEAEIALRWFA